MPELRDHSAVELGKKIRSGEVGVREALEATLARIEAVRSNAYITVTAEKALASAERIQRDIRRGTLDAPLAGVPAAVKDNICTEGVRTTCASRILGDFRPPYSATAVERMERAGAVIVGKANMDEFAMGSTNETSYYGPVQNPWNPEHTPGGSSGGSGAVVAGREAFYALGTDTGGSVRNPAAHCGVTGIKPTYGTVSRYGLIAYASSLDQIGVLGKNAEDCAAVLDMIGGRDRRDSTSMDTECGTFLATLTGDIRGMRIGLPEECFESGVNGAVREKVLEVGAALKALGAEIEYFSMPIKKYAVAAYYLIACAEASSNLSRFDGVEYGFRAEAYGDVRSLYENTRSRGFGREVKERILLGTMALSSGFFDAYYKKARQVRGMVCRAYGEAFEKYDLLLTPVSPSTAPRLGVAWPDPTKKCLGDVFTASVNLAGLPAISVPCGFDGDNLPVGAQLIGRPLGDKTVLNAAHGYQGITDCHRVTAQKGR